MLLSGEAGTETVTLTNNTDQEVAFDFAQYSGGDGLGGGDAVAPAHEGGAPHVALAKGEADPRRGAGQAFGAGGPDGFGYRWVDSNEPSGPAFDWVDIAETGTALALGDDAGETVELPFAFSFYGSEEAAVTIGSNGYLTFGTDGTDFSNDAIPDATDPNAYIAPFWDDLDPGDGVGTVYYQDMGDGRFVVQYEGVPPFPGPGDGADLYTFQVVLDQNGSILLQYEEMIGELDGATVGIENADGSDGLQVAFNEAYVEGGLAVLISARPSFVTGVEPATGTIPAGGSAAVDVAFSAEGLNGGSYEGTLLVDTDLAADPSTFELPVVLEVTGVAACAISPDPVAFGGVIVGAEATAEVTVSNEGTDACTLSDASADAADFVVDFAGPVTLEPGASTAFDVTFSPSAVGPIAGTLTVSTDGEALTASLEGTGLAPPSFSVAPASLAFTVTAGEASEPQSITLSNTGAGAGTFSVSVANASPRGLTPSVGGVDPLVTVNGPEEAALLARLARGTVVSARANATVTARPNATATARPNAASARAGAPAKGSAPGGTALGSASATLGSAFGGKAFGGGEPGDLLAQTPTVVGVGGIGQGPDGTIYLCDLNAGAQTETFAYDVDAQSFTSTGSFAQPGDAGTNVTGCTYYPEGDGGAGALWYLNANLGAGTAKFVETDLAGVPTGAEVPITGLAGTEVPIGLSYNEATGLFFLVDIGGDDVLSIAPDGAVQDVVPQTCLDMGGGIFGNALDALGDGLDVLAGAEGETRPTRVQVTEFDGSCRGDGEGNDLFTPITATEDAFINAVLRDRRAPNEVMYLGANSDAALYAVLPVEREDLGSFLTVSPESGTVEAGGSQALSVVADASDLEVGTYAAEVVIETDDPSSPVLVVDVTVEVVANPGTEGGGVPAAFALGQNYPNPFASRTAIAYALPEAAHVRLSVYDAVGRRVAVLVDGEQAAGRYEASFDASGLASGVYVYRLEAGARVATRKLSLVR
jgi:hypothetical protein